MSAARLGLGFGLWLGLGLGLGSDLLERREVGGLLLLRGGRVALADRKLDVARVAVCVRIRVGIRALP